MFSKKIKVATLITAMLMVVSVNIFAASKQQAAIEKFFKSYEAVVVSAEKAAKTNSLSDLLKVQEKVLKMADEIDEVQSFDEWTMKDSARYLELTNRYTKALTALSGSTTTMDLSSFGF